MALGSGSTRPGERLDGVSYALLATAWQDGGPGAVSLDSSATSLSQLRHKVHPD
ncbi:MAG: hypothetical protein IPL41_16890 [Micropruina sp.]|nr:hypothetical protein [Micropruina sp.]